MINTRKQTPVNDHRTGTAKAVSPSGGMMLQTAEKDRVVRSRTAATIGTVSLTFQIGRRNVVIRADVSSRRHVVRPCTDRL